MLLSCSLVIATIALLFINPFQKRKDKLDNDWAKDKSFRKTNRNESLLPNNDKVSQEKEELNNEQLKRTTVFLTEKGISQIRNSFIVIVGLGGVGSNAAMQLLRNGCKRFRLIDFDQITLSSLNRHACATRADVGKSKVEAVYEKMREIFPDVQVDCCARLFNMKNAEELMSGSPDYVLGMYIFHLDCIDHVQSKAELIKYCVDLNIKIISAMGAGAKCDPSRIQIADLSETSEDSLARATRFLLRDMGCKARLPVVYSTERSGIVKLLPLEANKLEDADSYAPLATFR